MPHFEHNYDLMAFTVAIDLVTSWLCTQTCSRLPCPELCFWRFGWSTWCHAHRYDWCPALPGWNDTGPVGKLDKWMILPGQLCVLTLCDRKLSCNRRSFIFGAPPGSSIHFSSSSHPYLSIFWSTVYFVDKFHFEKQSHEGSVSSVCKASYYVTRDPSLSRVLTLSSWSRRDSCMKIINHAIVL